MNIQINNDALSVILGVSILLGMFLYGVYTLVKLVRFYNGFQMSVYPAMVVWSNGDAEIQIMSYDEATGNANVSTPFSKETTIKILGLAQRRNPNINVMTGRPK